MNQIICDICGSEYPEGYDRCPTCSYPRQGGEKIVAAGAVAAVPEKVKGGRFSAKNVKKRRKAQKKAAQAAEAAELAEAAVPQEQQKGNPNKPLWITILILLLAIILVTAYIAMRFGQGMGLFLPTQTEAPTTTAAATVPTETTVPPTVPCAGMTLETAVIALDEAGQQHQIGMKLIPENTTDVLSFSSQDPAIAQVDSNGMLTATGSGQTTITITCGQIVQECTVVCWFEDATTAPVETTAPTVPAETTGTSGSVANGRLKLDQEDVSCFAAGESFNLYAQLDGESVSRSKITWSSSDPKVAKVDKGTVTSVSKGMATITAEYNGMKAECIVRCRFENTDGSQAQGNQENAKWKASHTDVSISVGESFRLKVTDSAGELAKAVWTMDVDGVVSMDGRTVTGHAPGIVTLTTEVEGVTMTCIVRVR